MAIRLTPPHDPAIWNLHSHSRYSWGDAMPTVEAMVERVVALKQPALGNTDHGNMAGTTHLYKACQRAGIKAYPGSELYVVPSREAHKAAKTPEARAETKRRHMCVVAYTNEGYRNLVHLSTMTHLNFHNKPLIDLADITELGEAGRLKGIAATSGCYFGLPIQMLMNDRLDGAKAMLAVMDKAFDRFYVELQNHNIDQGDGWTDSTIADTMLDLATEMGLPCVLTQDAHYALAGDQHDHDAWKRLVAFGDDPDDAVFPGDGFHLGDTSWFLRHHEGKRLAAGREGLLDLLDAHDLTIPALDHYSYNIPLTVADPDGEITRKCLVGLAWRRAQAEAAGKRALGQRYEDRLLEELEIVRDTGMSGYLLLVAECTDWLREQKIMYATRGSASGSMINWCLLVTQLDPIKWTLPFDRFISRDRTKPPDVDLDIEHDRRLDFITWLRGRFAVHQIGTWLKYSMNDEEDGEDGGGSLLRAYYSVKNRTSDSDVKITWGQVPREDRNQLHRLSDRVLLKAAGVHPAGLVLTTSEEELRDLVPLMRIGSSKTMVTQYAMKEVESLGLVKLDVLGLKTLTVLRHALANLGKDYDDWLDPSWIPFNDSATYTTISAGNTDGVFQLDGYAARTGCKDLKPRNIHEVIAAMALFRPAIMNSGATASYVRRKHGHEQAPKRHPLIASVVDSTHGIVLYQDQVIGILKAMGMTPDDYTLFLKAVKSSNDNVEWAQGIIAQFRPGLEAKAQELGFTEADWDWLWHAIEGFGNYGFNIAHASAYGVLAYYCAYLLAHHPKEYYAALLAVAAGEPKQGKKRTKEDVYSSAARKNGIRLLKADVNYSGVTYTVDKRGVRKGLLSVNRVGKIIARCIVDGRGDTPFTSLDDFCSRVNASKVSGIKEYRQSGDSSTGVLGILVEAGTFNTIMEDA